MSERKIYHLPNINNDEFYGYAQRRAVEDDRMLISSNVSDTLKYLGEYLKENDYVIENNTKDLAESFKKIDSKIMENFNEDKIGKKEFEELMSELEHISSKIDY